MNKNLVAAEAKYHEECRSEGVAQGREWATDIDDVEGVRMLKNLAKARDTQQGDWEIFDATDSSVYTPDELLAFIMMPELHGDRDCIKQVFGEPEDRDETLISEPAFVKGFASGAVAVWDARNDD